MGSRSVGLLFLSGGDGKLRNAGEIAKTIQDSIQPGGGLHVVYHSSFSEVYYERRRCRLNE